MTNTVGFRPKLLPPQGRRLERSYRPLLTCLTVSGCITVLVCVVFGLTAFNIYSHRFGRTQHHYHAGDEMSLRQASSDLSDTFCSVYGVQPMGWTDFYLLPRQAEIESGERTHMSFTLTALPVPFVKAIHYLPVNSTVTLSACYKNLTSDLEILWDYGPPAMFLVIVGDDNFREWGKHFNSHHVRFTVPIPHNATCSDPSSMANLTLTVPSSDNYHFVLRQQGTPSPRLEADGRTHAPAVAEAEPPTLILTGNILKTQFNLTGAQTVCNYTEDVCKFPLQWGHHEDVVAKIRTDSENADASVTFVTRCHERLEFWIPVFGGVPVLIMVLMWVWCWYLLMKRRNLRSRYVVRQASQVSRTDYGSFREESDPLITEVPLPEDEPITENEERCASIQG